MSPGDRFAGAAREAPAAQPIRVMVVDDHRMITEWLEAVLGFAPDIRIVAVARSVADVREMASTPVDVVLMDYVLPDGTGIQATRIMKARWPSARVVMLTAVDDDETILESIQAGADGYMTKDHAIDDVLAMVRAAHAGATLLPREVIMSIARRVVDARDRFAEEGPLEALTPRELDVLRALTEGLSTPEICQKLAITPNTLRTHAQNILGKLQVHSKLEAVAFALRHRLVEPPRAN